MSATYDRNESRILQKQSDGLNPERRLLPSTKRHHCAKLQLTTMNCATPENLQVSAVGKLINSGKKSTRETAQNSKQCIKENDMDSLFCNKQSRDCGVKHQACTQCSNATDSDVSKISSTRQLFHKKQHDSRRLRCALKMPDWTKTLALFFILYISTCEALPTIQSSKQLSLFRPDETDASPTAVSARTAPARRKRVRSLRRSNRGVPSFIGNHGKIIQLLNSDSAFFLEINEKLKVTATMNGNSEYTKLKIISIRPGYVAFKFKKTNRYLAMKPKGKGKLYASADFDSESCVFQETLSDRYFVYELETDSKRGRKKSKKRVLTVKRGKARRGTKITKNARFVKYVRDP